MEKCLLLINGGVGIAFNMIRSTHLSASQLILHHMECDPSIYILQRFTLFKLAVKIIACKVTTKNNTINQMLEHFKK